MNRRGKFGSWGGDAIRSGNGSGLGDAVDGIRGAIEPEREMMFPGLDVESWQSRLKVSRIRVSHKVTISGS